LLSPIARRYFGDQPQGFLGSERHLLQNPWGDRLDEGLKRGMPEPSSDNLVQDASGAWQK
jgi:hypothetical protein